MLNFSRIEIAYLVGIIYTLVDMDEARAIFSQLRSIFENVEAERQAIKQFSRKNFT